MGKCVSLEVGSLAPLMREISEVHSLESLPVISKASRLDKTFIHFLTWLFPTSISSRKRYDNARYELS